MTPFANVALRGTWTLSFTTHDQPREFHGPYTLITRPPNRLYLEIGTSRVWFDGTNLTVADATAQRYIQTNHNKSTISTLWWKAPPLLHILPFGHPVLLDDVMDNTLLGDARRAPWTPGPGSTWQGRPVQTLESLASTGDAQRKTQYRVSVDPETGITVAGTAEPDDSEPPPDECRSAGQQLCDTFRYQFAMDEVDVDTVWPDEVFQPQLDPTWQPVSHIDELWRHSTRPDHLVAALASHHHFSKIHWTPPERPAGWVQLWTTRLCAEPPKSDYPSDIVNRIPTRHALALEETNLVLRRFADGGEDFRMPVPASVTLTNSYEQLVIWVQGEEPADDRFVFVTRVHGTNELSTADRTGALHLNQKEIISVYDRVAVLPAGGQRREMLAIIRGSQLRLWNPRDGQILHELRLVGEKLEITDRDGDRLPEFIFIGRDVSAYEWPADR